MERRGGRSPSIMGTSEFRQAIEVYEEVLRACNVPPDDVQKQLKALQEPTIPRRQVMGFITLAQQLQATPLVKKQ